MKLAVQIDFDKILNLETSKNSVIVGRSSESNFVIPHQSISRSHCKIEFVNNTFFITDLKSLNGTFIDGVKILPEKKTLFHQNSVLKLGTLDCELTESHPSPESTRIQSQENRDHQTATITVSRLEFQKGSQTLELEKKNKIKGPKNPITGLYSPMKEELNEDNEKSGKGVYVILFIIVAIVIAYLLKTNIP